jgi:hypothetical protein
MRLTRHCHLGGTLSQVVCETDSQFQLWINPNDIALCMHILKNAHVVLSRMKTHEVLMSDSVAFS